MTTTTKRMLIGAAVAGILGAGLTSAPTVASARGKKVQCSGVNGCKGKGQCKSATNECKGKNDCKGKGWVKMSEAKCTKKGGTVVAPQG